MFYYKNIKDNDVSRRRPQKLFESIDKNIEYLKSLFDESADFTVREFYLSKNKCAIITIEGMINKDTFAESVLNPVIRYGDGGKSGKELFERIKLKLLSASEVVEIKTIDEVLKFSMSGFAVVAVDNCSRMLAIGVQGFSFRGISEPETEVSQRGSREGFVEPLRINMTLIRRRIKNPALKFEQMTLGDTSQTDICLCYLNDRADKKVIKELKKRLNSVTTETVLAAGYLVDFLDDDGISIFSGVGLSERPDTVCGKLTEGRIAIVIDGTPSVLIVPYLFVENFQTLDDYSERPYFATITRWLKYLSFFVSIFTPALYVAAAVYNPEIFPEELLSLISESVASTPFPIMIEVLVIYFIYEVMREAGLRLPRTLGHAVSIVGALVIGETAVSAGLIGPPTLMVVAITAISSYVIPNLYAPAALIRVVFVIIGGLFGFWGISIASAYLLIMICGKNSFGIPYTMPVSPLSVLGLRDVIIRAGWKSLSKKRFNVS